MDSRAPPMYLHPGMSMMGESHIGSSPGSLPINVPMGNPTPEVSGMQGVHMSQGNHPIYSHKEEPNEMPPEQQHYNQLPHRNEIYDEGTVCNEVLPETSGPLHNEDELEEELQQKVKSEDEEEIDNFVKPDPDHEIYNMITSKELTIKQAADKLGRKYSCVYREYQEFCEKGNVKDQPEVGTRVRIRTSKGKKGRKKKRLTYIKSRPRLDGVVYQCQECPAIFYRESQLKYHSKVHLEENESHECTACGVVLSKLNKLMQHRIEFHQEALQCPHCESQFTTVISYKNHIITHTGGKPFKCNECDKSFSQKHGLTNHKRSHTGERPFMCGICGKTFRTINGVKSHRFLHTGGQDKPYECDICDARFNFKQNLMRHQMMHEGRKPHTCDLCPAAFYLSTDLKSHKMAHTGIKPFKCDMCDYACTRKSNLVFHRNTHTGENPYKCDFYGCNAEYPRPNSLKKHKLKLNHGPPPPEQCKICHEKFTQLVDLKRHMMSHTGEKPHTCDQCFKTFVDVSDLKRHMWTHMSRPLTKKTKQVRHRQKNPAAKKANPAPPVAHKYQYQEPVIAENGHSSQGLPPSIPEAQNLSQINPQNLSQISPQNLSQISPQNLSQISHHSWNIGNINSEYIPNLVNNAVNNVWPASTMDPEEFRRRLLHSFK